MDKRNSGGSINVSYWPAALLAGWLAASGGLMAAESGDCVRGKSGAPLKIEVFSDFQCPACRAFYLETMRQVMTEYGDTGKACIVYREFPLNMHPHARAAARWGHAAMKLGSRQWNQVADALFQNQDEWAKAGDIEASLAKTLPAADLAELKKQLQTPAALNAAVDADIQLGIQKELTSTPTFYVTAAGKTEKVAGFVRFPILKRYLDTRPGP